MGCICSGVYLANHAMCSGKSVWNNSGFAQPFEISIARARGAYFAFLKDIQLTLQWCCYLWNQEETLQNWGKYLHGSWGNICLCHWPAHQSTWSQHTVGALSGINSLRQATENTITGWSLPALKYSTNSCSSGCICCSVNCHMASAWNIYLCFDLYFDYSTKSSARAARATTTRINQLQPQTPLPNREAVLKTSANKVQLNALMSNEILNDNAFLKSATASHQLVDTGEKTNPVEVFRVTYSHDVIFQQRMKKQTPSLPNMPSTSPKTSNKRSAWLVMTQMCFLC